MSWWSQKGLERQRLGDFAIGREIGRGGMGVVYEALQVSLNRKVALKVLSTTLGLTTRAVQRFQNEAEAAAKLHHTNIVPIYAMGEESGTHFYAMELIEGPSLDQVLRQLRQTSVGTGAATATRPATPDPSPLDATGPCGDRPGSSSHGTGLTSSSLNSGGAYFDTVARMMADVADALHHAHQQGVIHRDIKPSNLLLSTAGRLSVNDFGLARMLEQPGMTVTGEIVGTPLYMSPEQIAAGRVPLDHRTDVYSLGATLYELLTLQPPFEAERRDQLLAQIIQKEPRPPRKVNSKVPVDLETICLKAMDKDPDRRYQTTGQMAEDLRRYVNRFAILARRASTVARLRKWVKRNPSLAAALTVVLVCLVAAGGLGFRAHLAERQRVQDLARHEAELLEEKRRGALSKAILAARLEDFDGARQAIREAEGLGCSTGQIQILQGQLALYHGDPTKAIDHLRRATELLPDSVAAWSMLAVAYDYAGRQAEYVSALDKATRLPAVTPEDYLFRGHAESVLDPDRALSTLDEAVRRRPSALASLVHTEALRLRLLNVPDVELAKQIMDDVRALKRQLPENPLVLSLSILIHLTCFHLFNDVQLPALRQTAVDEGMKDAQALVRYPQSLRGGVARWVFLRDTGRSGLGVADLERYFEGSRDGPKDVLLSHYYGQFLYMRGDIGKALQVYELNKGEILIDFSRVIAQSELPGGLARAAQLYSEIASRELGAWDLFNSQLLLRFLGRKDEAIALSRKFLTQSKRFPPVRQEPFRRALEYCAGQLTAEELVARIGGHRGDLCNAHLCIALTALADGNRIEARKHLQLCLNTRYFEFAPYDYSLMLLSRMEKDAQWPHWTKTAK
jgi:serine/threonine protein kinase